MKQDLFNMMSSRISPKHSLSYALLEIFSEQFPSYQSNNISRDMYTILLAGNPLTKDLKYCIIRSGT
jgi:hypothetical protein